MCCVIKCIEHGKSSWLKKRSSQKQKMEFPPLILCFKQGSADIAMLVFLCVGGGFFKSEGLLSLG